MMKKTMTLLVLALLGTGMTQAQRADDGDRAQQRKERIERQAQQQAKDLKLDEATTTWFTNLYVEYQTELQQVREAAMKDMPKPEKAKKGGDADDESANPENLKEKELKKLTDEQAEKIIQANFDRTEKELKVKRDYYARFREKLTPKQLVRIFAQPGRGGQRGGQRGGMPRGGGFPGGPMGGPGGGFPGGGF